MPAEGTELVCELYALLIEVDFVHYFYHRLVSFFGVVAWVVTWNDYIKSPKRTQCESFLLDPRLKDRIRLFWEESTDMLTQWLSKEARLLLCVFWTSYKFIITFSSCFGIFYENKVILLKYFPLKRLIKIILQRFLCFSHFKFRDPPTFDPYQLLSCQCPWRPHFQ